jgi:hypothetical protein
MKPFTKRAPLSEKIEHFISPNIKPVFVITVNTGKHAKMDCTQSSIIIAVTHTYNL